jgi:hypothetical protein
MDTDTITQTMMNQQCERLRDVWLLGTSRKAPRSLKSLMFLFGVFFNYQCRLF